MAEKLRNCKSTSRKELHERIIQEAKRLFKANGIKVMTMDSIAADLTISKRTLYEEFPDKETLVMEVLDYMQEEKNKNFRQIYETSQNVLETILRVYYWILQSVSTTSKDYFNDLNRYPQVAKMHEKNKLQARADVVSFLMKGVEQGLFRDGINYNIVNEFLDAQLEAMKVIIQKYPTEKVFEVLAFTFLRGIATDKGNKLIDKYKQDYEARLIK